MSQFDLRVSACAVVLLTAVGLSPMSARAASAERPAAAQSYTFAFSDADVSQVAEAILGQTLGVAYSVDPAVTAKMTFRIERRLTKPQLLEAFEAALASNDIAMVREGDALRITPRAKAKTAATIETNGELAHRAGFGIVAVPLAYAQPSEVAKALESVTPQGTVVYTSDKQGLLLLGGSGQELDSALQMVKVFDRSGMDGVKIRWFELSNAPAVTLANDFEHVVSAAGIGGIGVVPLKRLNGLFVFARTNEALDKASDWVSRLDQPSQEKTASLYVYHPKNLSAESLGRTLNSVMSGQAATDQTQTTDQQKAGVTNSAPSPQATVSTAMATQSQGFVSSSEDAVRVGVDKETNTLLISAPAGQWIQIQRILDEIDRQPAQVLIEASILEVTLTKDFQFGVDWSVLGAGGKLNVSNIVSASGTIAAQRPGLAVTFLNKDIQTAVNALGSKTTVEVVSAPKIMALDNHTAKLQVGDQVPTLSQTSENTTSAGAPIISSINYLATGVILNVTPRVSGDDKIMLDVSQEVSETVPQATSTGINSPTISERKFDSTLILKSGGVVALGGLISSTRTTGGSGIPYLQDVPGLGSLFKGNSNNLNRTELIVLLSAKIIRDEPTAQRAMADLLADMHEIQSRGLFKLPK